MNTRQTPPRRGISAVGLTIVRGERTLVSGLDFALASGGVLLLRGPNGAGKSSLLLTLCGILRPAAGTISVTGRAPDDRPGTDIHFLGHAAAIKPQLSVAENLRFWADLYSGIGNIGEILAQTGLGGLDALPAAYLSAGQTRRLALARLLVSTRPIWLLDEPTAALDADGEALVGRLIDGHASSGGIVIAATHHDLALQTAAANLHLGGPA